MPSKTSLSQDSGTEMPARKSSTWRWIVGGILVGFVGLGIRGWLHQQPAGSDSVQYFTLAQTASLSSEDDSRFRTVRTRVTPNSLRIVLLGVPASFSAILGTGPAPYYATIYTIALLSFAGIFSFAWVLSGPRTAVIATAVWATSYASISVDTQLTPDNLGTALAMIGLALIAYVSGLGRRTGVEPPVSRRKLITYAVIGGFLLWAAFSTRASFFVFACLGVALAMLAEKRWTIVAAVVVGGLLGEIAEVVYFYAAFGDPFLRWKAILGFGSALSGVGTSATGVYSGYTGGELFTRYPRILMETGSAEIVLHFVGLGVFVWWAVGWREPHRLAKAVCGFIAYGFLALAIARFDPVVPLMREKLRYYATAAPLFYVAVADLIDWALFRETQLSRLKKWVNGRPRLIVVGLLVTGGAIANLGLGSQSLEFAKNGNDGYLTVARVLESDAESLARPRVLHQDMRTARVMNILLPIDEWAGATGYEDTKSSDFEIREDGYLLLVWKRLNGNVRYGYVHGPRTHEYYRIIETQPLVARHRRGSELIDLFFVSKNAISREVVSIDESFPRDWSRARASTKTWEALSPDHEVVFDKDPGRLEYIYSGGGQPWRPTKGARLPGRQFFQAIVDARCKRLTRMRAYLFWWRQGAKRPTKQFMGTVWVGPESREFAMWTYLPDEAQSHRFVLRARSGVILSSVKTRTLAVHEDDRVQQFGGAWP